MNHTMMTELHPVRHRLVGDRSEVVAVLRNAQATGTLARVGSAQAVGADRVSVDLTLLQPVQPTSANRRPVRAKTRSVAQRRRRRAVTVVAVALVAVAVGGLGYVTWLVVEWVIAHLAIVVGSLVALAVTAVALLAKSGACVGLHCPGCGH